MSPHLSRPMPFLKETKSNDSLLHVKTTATYSLEYASF